MKDYEGITIVPLQDGGFYIYVNENPPIYCDDEISARMIVIYYEEL